MKSVVVLVVPALTLFACATPSPSLVTGEVLRSGLCAHREVARYQQAQSTAGYATVGALEVVAETNTILLKRDIGFGFTWRATGMPPVAEVDFVIQHPIITRPDGKSLEGFVEPLKIASESGVITSTDCYILSEEHELVPGKWSIEVRYRGQSIGRREFEVTAPR